PYLPLKANGSGDVTAALFTSHYVASRSAADALARTASSVFGLLEITHAASTNELKLIEAQEHYASPRMEFEARQLR
ncbi:MAG: pyridoxal kinase, partial [Microbacterium gubbeenense]